jgi:hypothetical protein
MVLSAKKVLTPTEGAMFKISVPENIQEALYIWNPARVNNYFKQLMTLKLTYAVLVRSSFK